MFAPCVAENAKQRVEHWLLSALSVAKTDRVRLNVLCCNSTRCKQLRIYWQMSVLGAMVVLKTLIHLQVYMNLLTLTASDRELWT